MFLLIGVDTEVEDYTYHLFKDITNLNILSSELEKSCKWQKRRVIEIGLSDGDIKGFDDLSRIHELESKGIKTALSDEELDELDNLHVSVFGIHLSDNMRKVYR